jgi:hypothetical protein
MKNKTILLISPEAWGTNFVSKHHYANYLAKNNTVYFLNPVSNSIVNPFGPVNVKVEKLKDNLFSVNYQNLLPRLNVLPKFVQQFIFKKQAQQIQTALNIVKFDIVWSFDPYRFWNQTVWCAEKTIYHTVDFHPMAKFENLICKSSNFVLGVTPLVIDSIRNYKKIIHKIGHGADIDNFQIDNSISIPGENKIKACYTGNFHKHIDYNQLIQMANKNKDVDFILIGPIKNNNLSSGKQINQTELQKINNLQNVFLIGSVPSNQLMGYISQCTINLVMFKKEFETIHCSPHKLMAYFYSGNITISNYIDEHKNTSADIITMTNNVADISKLITEIKNNIEKNNSKELKEKRKQYAIQNSYDNKIEEISKLLYSN